MSLANVIALIECSDGDRALEVTRFPNAPLVRLRVRPGAIAKEGVVLDIHGLRQLADALDEQVAQMEDAP